MQLRKLIATTSAILIAFGVAIMPVYLHFDLDLKRPMGLLVPDVRANRAYANPVVVNGAKNFIKVAAAEAGLTPAQFVATTVGMVTVGCGYDITKGVGVNMADTLDNSVGNLIDAADYPSYDSLSAEEQAQWGSKDNYDSAKYNSLLNAFGMGEAQSRFFGSGGGDIDEPTSYDGWTQVEKDRLQQIGRIGSNWLNGARAKFGDIIGCLTDPEDVTAWIGSDESYVSGEGVNGWPSYVPRNLPVSYGNAFQASKGTSVSNICTSNNPVYYVPYTNTSSSYRNQIRAELFSKTAFIAYNDGNANEAFNASRITYNGETFYCYTRARYNLYASGYIFNMTVNSFGNILSSNDIKVIGYRILFGEILGNVEKIENYPTDDIPDDENIYFPNSGITPNITYNQFITPTRQNNVYNPENQTGGEDWRDETEANVLPLMNIQFDKLFPFCMLFDIQKLFDKVTAVTGSSGTQETYMTVSIPLDVPGFSQGETLDLNLQWLHDLLVTVRPFVQILLAAGLLFVTIRFWQGVLTG